MNLGKQLKFRVVYLVWLTANPSVEFAKSILTTYPSLDHALNFVHCFVCLYHIYVPVQHMHAIQGQTEAC